MVDYRPMFLFFNHLRLISPWIQQFTGWSGAFPLRQFLCNCEDGLRQIIEGATVTERKRSRFAEFSKIYFVQIG
jgi:hypothetical protein